ncbi:hypothetical protein [Streptomyces anulatus]|uniref:hypothetical protein n=1 Tax=Streptomyces anulatus TaxID=1892 RepID=UPI0036C72E07
MSAERERTTKAVAGGLLVGVAVGLLLALGGCADDRDSGECGWFALAAAEKPRPPRPAPPAAPADRLRKESARPAATADPLAKTRAPDPASTAKKARGHRVHVDVDLCD